MNIFLILKLINWKIYMNNIIDINKLALIPDLGYYIKEIIKENKKNTDISYDVNNIINLFLYIFERYGNIEQSINIVLSRIKDDYQNNSVIKEESPDEFFPIKDLIIKMLIDLYNQLLTSKYIDVIFYLKDFYIKERKNLLITKWFDDYTFVLELCSLFNFDESQIVNGNLVYIKPNY